MSDDETVKRLVAGWYERERNAAEALLEEAEQSETVGEAVEIAHQAKLHLARAEAFQDVQKVIGLPEADRDE